jgi:signal transduction histidine kinase
LRTVEKLNQAADAPRFVEFDLTNVIELVLAETGLQDRVGLGREDPLVCIGDPALLSLALGIAVNNAVEATLDDSLVIVTAATTDRETWVRVLDEGIGLPNGSDKVFSPGRTTKSKEHHFGWGLSIAQRAVHSFGGNISLTPRTPAGTACEISWPRPGVAVDEGTGS